ncbi:MAG TPA: DUF6105 family protein, partial [Mycoplana sp.]|nr:DUF6105 family protein [Mycoplana sp.]
VLGIPPESIPPLVARAIVVDSLFVFAIIAFRRRKRIMAWWKSRRQRRSDGSAQDLPSAESLSSAP